MMDALQEYYIPFTGLKLGKHTFTFHIDNSFFEVFKYDDFQEIDCNATVFFTVKSTFFELQINIEGSATLNCDITNEPFIEVIENEIDLIVKFGDEYNDENDEVLIIEHSEHQLNVAQFIYEAIVLAIPLKRIHPGVEDGTLKSDIFEKLKELEIKKDEKTDPRWEKLNNLLTSKKQ